MRLHALSIAAAVLACGAASAEASSGLPAARAAATTGTVPGSPSSEATGQALAFASAREGTSLFEPRVEIATARFVVQAGDVLEYDLLMASACADRAGVEITFSDGRRSEAPRVGPGGSWRRERVPLDPFVGSAVVRFELVARGSLAEEIGYRIDEIVVTHAEGEPFVVFGETLQSGARLVRDDLRHTGAAVVDVNSSCDGVRTEIAPARIVEPWNAYDMANLRRGADGVSAGFPADPGARLPRGSVIVGPCVPMMFAAEGERNGLRAAGQRLAFEPLEGGRFYSLWLAVSSEDGAEIVARGFGYGDGGERCAIDFVVPSPRTTSELSVDLGGFAVLEVPVAASAPLRGFELPNEPRLRVHAITIQWRKDGLNSPPFRSSWLVNRARTARDLTPERQRQIWRYVRNRWVGPLFGASFDDEVDRTIFTALLDNDMATFETALATSLADHATRGEPLKSLRLAIEDVRDGRGIVRVAGGLDGEALLQSFAAQRPGTLPEIEGAPAELRQAPQIMAGLGIAGAMLRSGPAVAIWRGSDGASVPVLAPSFVLNDTREFGDSGWRKWLRSVRTLGASPEILLSISSGTRSQKDATEIVALFARLDCTPRVWLAQAETFLSQARGRLGSSVPDFVPGDMPSIADADARLSSERTSAVRGSSAAIALLSTFGALASTDGSPYPADAMGELERRRLDLVSGATRSFPDAVATRAENALQQQLDVLARGASTQGQGTPIVVFNSLPWTRAALVQLDAPSAVLTAAKGNRLTSQLTATGSRIFALDVPALGYAVVHGLQGGTAQPGGQKDGPAQGDRVPLEALTSKLVVAGTTARNEHLSFTFDAASGALESLMLLPQRLEMLAGPALPMGSGWSVVSAAFVESGPLRAIARIEMTSSRGRARLEFVLEARARELEVRLSSEPASTEAPLAFRLPLVHAGPRVVLGAPFGFSLTAPLTPGASARHRLLDWLASSDGERGVVVLAGDCTSALVEPDAIALESNSSASTTSFALLPFASGWRVASPAAHAAQFATPVQLVATDAHDGARAARHSFLSIARANAQGQAIEGPSCGVVLSALQPALDGNGWLLRLVETTRNPAEVTITFDRPVFAAERVDLRGSAQGSLRIEERRVRLTMGPNRIETVRVRLHP